MMTSPPPYKVLSVDDNLVNLKLIEKSLSKEGYQTFNAENGPDAMAIAIKEKPDLILLDIEMPGQSGFDVIKTLKNTPETNAIPVIFLTGINEIDSKLKGFDLGAVDYITKPFHPQEVLARVRLQIKLSIATNSLIERQASRLKQVTQAQVALLPGPGDIPGTLFGVYYKALEEAGGDFYDILNISDTITGYFVADFSGHDIKTSFMTASLKALLIQNCSSVYGPGESMKMINDVLVKILPDSKYLTACYLHLNRTTKKLTIVNAGHPPVVCMPLGADPYLITMEGDILGIFKDAQFGVQSMTVSKGDRFFVYSDGLVESTAKKITWVSGADSLLPVCRQLSQVPCEKAPAELIRHLFGSEVTAEDDIVVLCIEV